VVIPNRLNPSSRDSHQRRTCTMGETEQRTLATLFGLEHGFDRVFEADHYPPSRACNPACPRTCFSRIWCRIRSNKDRGPVSIPNLAFGNLVDTLQLHRLPDRKARQNPPPKSLSPLTDPNGQALPGEQQVQGPNGGPSDYPATAATSFWRRRSSRISPVPSGGWIERS
jgi:hypothetical protein